MSSTMTSTIMEATSLKSLTELAANPPSNPNQPLPAGSPPLVLYIARVPGSRDVFLTPIKPREKVVMASDVQSSLYYVHINCDDDYSSDRSGLPLARPSSVNTDASHLPSLAEKPKRIAPPLPKRRDVPMSLPYPADDGPPMIQARPPSPPKYQRIGRKPILSGVTNSSPSRQPRADLPRIPPRPLPTPPIDDPEQADSLHDDTLRLLRRSSHIDPHENPYSRHYQTHPETLKQLDLDSRAPTGSLTLIRRDPGSSDQWNVATINDPPVEEVSSSTLLVPTASRRTKKGGAPLYLDISNTAYSQFITRPTRSESRISISSSASSDTSESPSEGVFRRRLYMPGSRFAEHGYSNINGSGHRKHFSVSSFSSEDVMRQTMRERHSVDMGSVGSPTADRRSKGYTFTSPWNGQCEFTTGTTGRSLKCRHYLGGGGGGSGGGGVREVSELRFNLSTKSSSLRPGLPQTKSASSYFKDHRHLFSHNRSHSDNAADEDDGNLTPTIVVDEEGRIDLSLGQERAGGGFGGKQAKLGKLIIEPEGVKMLDLLVAANVGLWWRAWERVSPSG